MNQIAGVFFTFIKVAEGVFVAIAKERKGALANAGLIDMGGEWLVVDTSQSPKAAKELLDFSQNQLHQPVTKVISSHWHLDHVLGNQVFENSEFIATQKTKQLIHKKVPNFIEYAKQHPEYPKMVMKEAEEEKDPVLKEEALMDAFDMQHLDALLHEIKIIEPTTTFSSKKVIEGNSRNVVLENLGPCHSEDDSMLFLPDDEIVFTGDIVFNGFFPTLANGDLQNWIKVLYQLKDYSNFQLVPGHGQVANHLTVEQLCEYLEMMADTTDLDSTPLPHFTEPWKRPSQHQRLINTLKEETLN